jgi:hypothetical protein
MNYQCCFVYFCRKMDEFLNRYFVLICKNDSILRQKGAIFRLLLQLREKDYENNSSC